MNIPSVRWIVAMLVLAMGASLSADRVRLRSGKVVEGTFIGADSKAVRILLDDGQISEIPIGLAIGVEFTERKAPAAAPAAAAAPAPPPRPKPAAAPKPITVPAGTMVNVRLTQGIDVDASQAGQSFKAIVDDPVMIGGSVVIPRGASAVLQAASVQQSGTMKGSDKITLKMNSIAFGGMAYQVASSYVETKGKGEGKKTGRKIGGGAGLGAIVGGIAGGGSGAAIGAAVGAAGGAVMAASGEEHLKLPAETRLQFQLSSAVNVRP
jgi:hypothetical protein